MSNIDNVAATVSTASLDYSVFRKAIENACKIVERRNTIPVLDTVLIKATTNGVYVLGTDLDICTTTFVPGNVSKDFTALVDAHKLKATMDKVKDAPAINFAMSQKKLTANIGKLNLTLKQDIPAEDFPESHAFRDRLSESNHTFTLPSATLLKILNKVQFAISTEETRYYLNGVYMHVIENSHHITFVATDGHRLARYEMPAPEGANGIPAVIIPRKTIVELMRLLKRKGCPEETMITVCKTGVRFTVGEDETVDSKVIDGQFPDYTRVIPMNNDHHATIYPASFIDGVKQASAVLPSKGGSVSVNFLRGIASLTCRDVDFGEASVDVSIENERSLEIGFNAQYLIDILSHVDGEAKFMLMGAGDPVVIRNSDDDYLTFVQMPTRI